MAECQVPSSLTLSSLIGIINLLLDQPHWVFIQGRYYYFLTLIGKDNSVSKMKTSSNQSSSTWTDGLLNSEVLEEVTVTV